MTTLDPWNKSPFFLVFFFMWCPHYKRKKNVFRPVQTCRFHCYACARLVFGGSQWFALATSRGLNSLHCIPSPALLLFLPLPLLTSLWSAPGQPKRQGSTIRLACFCPLQTDGFLLCDQSPSVIAHMFHVANTSSWRWSGLGSGFVGECDWILISRMPTWKQSEPENKTTKPAHTVINRCFGGTSRGATVRSVWSKQYKTSA